MYRAPDFFERYNVCRISVNHYSNYHVTAQYNQTISRSLLSNALKQLILHHPALYYGVKLNPKLIDYKTYQNHQVGPVKSISFEDVVTISDKPFSEERLVEINHLCIPVDDENSVTWRIIVFSNNYICLYSNHIIIDGGAAAFFHHDLCAILAELSSQHLEFVPELYNQQVDGVKQHLGTDHVVDLYRCTSKLQAMSMVVASFIPKSVTQLWNSYTNKHYPDLQKFPLFECEQRKVIDDEFRLFQIPDETMTRLLAKCRQEGVTFTAFLDVLINHCFQKCVFPLISSQKLSTKSSIVTSGRRYYPEKAAELRYAQVVTGTEIYLPPIESVSVEAMKVVKQIIDTDLETRNRFKYVGLLSMINPYDILAPEKTEFHQDVLFEISNLGLQNIKNGDWAVSDIVFCQCTGPSTTFGFNVATTPGGTKITMGIKSQYAQSGMDEFEKAFYAGIEQFCSR
ncbi:hypothetical protein PSN45_005016 [Yamadazyma tenuis]|uniref:Alcohol acetyltransferase n=1 Tax=Candida tenuis (strain ATCC 10573 / BCRC 21748 / CBS 615 / JCM 9827 / NBRC 10315 / NRRL Y-1498 / VKM Y-70) TaxID=590646 RepID=G3B2H3_CANTC|nr:uncharacterized protein CANTEDRAFT_113465 [Yamadazyma tenuis ATCC 10573]EGV64675.1 hypothetical protein CANTEDRAFT_113465 [Yamadazyma tenuis ATCC 10573]WEJ97465.1 hypothetical protein PSN45_005016 [Yamadazyma tenuis]